MASYGLAQLVEAFVRLGISIENSLHHSLGSADHLAGKGQSHALDGGIKICDDLRTFCPVAPSVGEPSGCFYDKLRVKGFAYHRLLHQPPMVCLYALAHPIGSEGRNSTNQRANQRGNGGQNCMIHLALNCKSQRRRFGLCLKHRTAVMPVG
jgi:hypothetical protein